ncbi:regulatory protein ral2 [Drechmeria coniospora]|uniref:Regulatory protein ral2 n=1 Tax=Drechmeria coniospora TaxID=98403 RepID=A0A151GKK6_DRECN|nr:regulatory protein ral2 [Drechmeria coniospora]KYK57653.1 regulatory protein ral2 [Drechmeria coniospora]
MAHPARLTNQQKSPRTGLPSLPGSGTHERKRQPPSDPYDLDCYPGVYRGVQQAPWKRQQPRKGSVLGFDWPSPNASHSHQRLPTGRSSSASALQHATQSSLKHSLDKPLPQPPSPPTYTTLALLAGGTGRVGNRLRPNIDRFQGRSTKPKMDGRTSTTDSGSSNQMYGARDRHAPDVNSSMSSLASSVRHDAADEARDGTASRTNGPAAAAAATTAAATAQERAQAAATPIGGPPQGSSAHLSGLMCNVHRTTGREPPPLVGATTTILGDKLYVFGGRALSRSRPAPLTADLFELDLIRRHWTKLEAAGDLPPPRYFHSMCPLGDTKLVCYGGMSPAPTQPAAAAAGEQQQAEVAVMSDIYVYDTRSNRWTYLPAQDPPQGRYAHCACILSSAAAFSSKHAPLSALQHNPSSANPNEGRIGINIDGTGGAEMVVVGGQDGANHYIEQISVFNLRSLKWTSTQSLGKSCGAYRSVVAPLPPSVTAKIGKPNQGASQRLDGGISLEARELGSSMLIYSNYNFLDVKLELQIRASDGSLTERPMSGTYSPPGLRFPNGGIIDTHFVVSGTYLTSSKQEYALWALDLRTLTWSRIDAGGSVFSQGSWNRGVLWNRRNTFVILGNRKRSLVEDYNHRRINFSNVCMVELEAFGFYDNPRKTNPMSGFISASSPYSGGGFSLTRKAGYTAGGRFHSRASEELGEKALNLRELSDMDILCIAGERVPVNSRILARRWGPYFVQLLREGTATQDGSDAVTLRSGHSSNAARASAMTATPRPRTTAEPSPSGSGYSGHSGHSASTSSTSAQSGRSTQGGDGNPVNINSTPTPRSLPPNGRPRCLYLPHTFLTVQALLHFLYTSSLPLPTSPLCTPQILCSLLQIARPYRVDGLLEAIVERLHALLDSRNAAAVFNATAMAAGGGRGIDGSLNPNYFISGSENESHVMASNYSADGSSTNGSSLSDLASTAGGLSLNTKVPQQNRPSSGELSATSVSGSEQGSEIGASDMERFVWNAELSSVIGLQKRGLRGLMDGRRMRERSATGGAATLSTYGAAAYIGGSSGGGQRLGLGLGIPG